LQDLSFWQWAWQYRVKISLPVMALTIHTFAMLTLQFRGSLMAQLAQDYMRTARSKGLTPTAALVRHALPNALFPMITLLSATLPLVVSGSIAIESIFNFHGLGEVMMTAFQQQNFPLLMSIVLLLSVVTIVANLIGDLLYAWADPRVVLSK
jgi:peptide/nickel transport system permease protein